MDLEESLAKIRPHTASSLAHQRTPALLLQAMEASFEERSATAYFAASLSALESSTKAQMEESTAATPVLKLEEGDRIPALLYLLALVAPHVPPLVLRSQLSTVLKLLSPLFPLLSPYAPPLRSQLSIFSALLLSLDKAQLDKTPGIKQSFATILQFSIDQRPKVRKKAIDVLHSVLSAPPSPLRIHPFAGAVVKWSSGAFSQPESAIHAIAMLKVVLPFLPQSSREQDNITDLVTRLLALPSLNNLYLSVAAYNLLGEILSLSDKDTGFASSANSSLVDIVHILLKNAPSAIDVGLAGAWAVVFGSLTLERDEGDDDEERNNGLLLTIFRTLFAYLQSSHVPLLQSTSNALSSFLNINFPHASNVNAKQIMEFIHNSLPSLPYAQAVPFILRILSSAILAFPKAAPTGNDQDFGLLRPLLTHTASLRTSKTFAHKEACDAVFSAGMRRFGPHLILDVVPLNLFPEDRKLGEPNAYLLPLLPSSHPSPLSHFISYFVPLSEKMFDLKVTAESQAEAEGATNNTKSKKGSEAKMWSVLVDQVWAGFAGYCWAKQDLRDSWTATFSKLLSQLLYTQTALRPKILRGLKVAVESNLLLSSPPSLNPPESLEPAETPNSSRASTPSSDTPDEPLVSKRVLAEMQVPFTLITQAQAQRNVEFLKTQAESWLSVLFNVFGSGGDANGATKNKSSERGMIGDVVRSWSRIAESSDLMNTNSKILDLVVRNLPATIATNPKNTSSGPSQDIVRTMLDLLLVLLPFLPLEEKRRIYNFFVNTDDSIGGKLLRSSDVGIQKRGWRILARLIDEGNGGLNNIGEADTEGMIAKLGDIDVAAGSKRERFAFLSHLIPHIPSTSLHLLSRLVPEAVLGTKEPGEKTRRAAFELVVAMGMRMAAGGVVKRSVIVSADGMDIENEENVKDVEATIEEYITMVAAGLAGATPHMISATVTALSRLIFEFHDQLSSAMLTEVLQTLIVFLTSTNREIVKSTLGFIKLAIHTLSVSLVSPHLSTLIPALLRWAKDHKNHFKLKVHHIFERMIRRFGWDSVSGSVPAEDEEGIKILSSIKRKKERAKKKKQGRDDAEQDDTKAVQPKHGTGDAFEDVLYGSESETEDDDGEEEAATAPRPQSAKRSKVSKQSEARLRMDDDEPMDLLEGVASRISDYHKQRRKPGKDASRFKTEEGTGRMVIADELEAEDTAKVSVHRSDPAGSAYMETMVSTDGFTRGANGKIKFNKDTKKRRRAEAELEDDIEMPDANPQATQNAKRPKRNERKLGHEFKAKKAGGDVRKGGIDPYAYLPLSQAAKHQKGGRGKIGVAGKR